MCTLKVLTVFIATLALCAALDATAYLVGDQVIVKTGVFDRVNGAGVAKYNQEALNISGWATLYVSTVTNLNISPQKRGYVVGVLEGYLSYELMWDAYLNWIESSLPPQANGKLPAAVENFMMTQKSWLEMNVAKYPKSSYWQHIGVLMNQVNGLAAGYNLAQNDSRKLTLAQVYTLTMAGDLEDLLAALSAEKPDFNKNLKKEWHMDCSGLIKVLPDMSNIFVGHTTFNGYWCMLRIFKHYEIPLTEISGTATITSFSSRPGDLESKDDFYLMNSGLVVIETSLTTFNRSLYASLTPNSVPCWLRSQLANRLAKTADEWVTVFSMYNSGTHNNQWIATDLNKMKHISKGVGGSLLPNTVWLLDQMGPYIESADVTHTLLAKNFIVPSFNIPYFPFIFNVSGYRDAGFSYENDVRHKIFQRDHVEVTDIYSMGYLMNSNNYQNDPLSGGNACNAISARCDLNEPLSSASAFGGIDAKAVDVYFGTTQKVLAIGGQTHQTQPPFSFSPNWNVVPHRGMPDLWNFDWGIMQVPSD